MERDWTLKYVVPRSDEIMHEEISKEEDRTFEEMGLTNNTAFVVALT